MANSNKIPIIICGNDGTGKTSLTSHFNSSTLSSNYHMLERSTPDTSFPSISKSQIKLLDEITLGYTWERPNLTEDDEIYRFILDLDVPTLTSRIKQRIDPITIWDLPKSLKYYNKRFHELAYYYGYPKM